MADPDVHAIHILGDDTTGPPQAFIDDHEFCHLHPCPTGSIHLTLPDAVRVRAIASGWVESHLIANQKLISKDVVLVYAPRDLDEVESVMNLITISYAFAKGYK
jgi:phospholipase/carboxylesterase